MNNFLFQMKIVVKALVSYIVVKMLMMNIMISLILILNTPLQKKHVIKRN